MPRRKYKTPQKMHAPRATFIAALALLFAGLWIGTLAATNTSVNAWLHAKLPQFFSASITTEDELPSMFEKNGKTYVAFDHPLVHLTVVTDSTCTEVLCDDQKILQSIYKELTPAIALTTVDAASDEGKALLAQYQLGGVPAFLFDQNITALSVYQQVADYFTPLNDNLYLLMTPFGRYYTMPEPGLAQGAGASAENAKTIIIAYESFSCERCKEMAPIIKNALTAHPEARFVFKHYDRGGTDALLAQAAECAGDQGKFWEMADALFEAASLPEDIPGLEVIAQRLELDADSFTTCIANEKYEERIFADTFEAKRFGVMGTPTFFVNGSVYRGGLSADELEQILAQ